jgi:hypothetical protein
MVSSFPTVFNMKDFVSDLFKLGTAYEHYDALTKICCSKDTKAGRCLYYEGRICDILPFLEKYRQYTDDAEYVQ